MRSTIPLDQGLFLAETGSLGYSRRNFDTPQAVQTFTVVQPVSILVMLCLEISIDRKFLPTLSNRQPMYEDNLQRTHALVEELRADVDFEIDDVISNIVRNLPEEYFKILSREEQITHLRALLAICICNLKKELTLRSEDGRHIAVVARQNYSGLLAKIIAGLPDELPLIGAKIFTSRTHDFIIDLFEFKPADGDQSGGGPSALNFEDLIASVASQTGRSLASVAEFVASYPLNSRVLESADEVREHFLAFLEARNTGSITVRWYHQSDRQATKLTVSARSIRARDLLLATAQFLSLRAADIEQAFLDDFPHHEFNHIAVCSFVVAGDLRLDSADDVSRQIEGFLQ